MDLSIVFAYDELQLLYDKFLQYDKDKNNVLSKSELLLLIKEVVADATEKDVYWFLCMIDMRVDDRITLSFPQYVRGVAEFAKEGKLSFRSHKSLHEALVRSGIQSLDITNFTVRRGLDWKQVDRVYTQFMNADANKSGTLSYDEMTVVFKKVVPKLPESEYCSLFTKIDKNNSGYVDFMEFLEWADLHSVPISLGRTKSLPKLGTHRSPLTKQKSKRNLDTVKLRSPRYSLVQAHPPVKISDELRATAFKAFAAMDANADGDLSEEEFHNALTEVHGNVPLAEKTRLYSLVDSDASGSISYEEFLYAVGQFQEVSKVASQMKNAYFSSRFPWEVPSDELTIEAQIGEGNFGVVSKGKWHGTPVAIKKLKDQSLASEVLEDFKKELTILAKLRHPNIVMLIGACTQPTNLYILTEYLTEGTVYHLLHKLTPPKKFAFQGIIKLALQVARGIAYLHRNKVIHRDLKSLNLLLDDNYVCKLCDFGLSCLIPTSGKLKEQVGSPLWMAPEVLQDRDYTEKIDAYSFAICMWEVLTNKLPWEGKDLKQMARAIDQNERPEIPSHVDSRFKDMITRCWDSNPDIRPSFEQIIEELEVIDKSIKNK